MKLYGYVNENADGYLIVSNWFFSPEDRENYVKEQNEHRLKLWGKGKPLTYEVDYWFVELDTDNVSHISCNHKTKEIEDEREAKRLAEEEEEER